MGRRKSVPFSPKEDTVIERARIRGLGPTAIARLLHQLCKTDRSPGAVNMRLKTLARQAERQFGVMRRAKRIDWTDEMVAALRALRDRGVPLYLCAEKVGVAYPTCVHKARELGIATRLSRGQIPGSRMVLQQAEARAGQAHHGPTA
jgi:hypothetical protein